MEGPGAEEDDKGGTNVFKQSRVLNSKIKKYDIAKV